MVQEINHNNMKTIRLKSVLATVLLLLFSCIETTVTNIVHPDGSVTRRIVIKDPESKNFDPENYRVPFDSTWNITDSIEVSENGDTTWIRTAEKLFKNVDEINAEYKNDKGSNKDFKREARFRKKFHWFNTIYVFSENIEPIYSYGYPIKQFLSETELEYFYLPENILRERLEGPDSTVVKQITDSVEVKSEKWMFMSNIAEWKEEFRKLAQNHEQLDSCSKLLQDNDPEIYSFLENAFALKSDSDMDTVFAETFKNILGEDIYMVLKPELDSSVHIIEERLSKAFLFSAYSTQAMMPGKLTATNGYIDKDGLILWPVKMEYFLTRPHEMWAESKSPNTWAWVVSGVFVGFVGVGVVLRLVRI
jgi:hypothetical protein